MPKVIIHNEHESEAGSRLQSILEDRLPQICKTFFCNIEVFQSRLPLYLTHDVILVVFVSNMDDLHKLNENRAILRDCRLLFVLPDNSAEIISHAYEYFPRFVTFFDSDFSDICAVIENIIKQIVKPVFEGEKMNDQTHSA